MGLLARLKPKKKHWEQLYERKDPAEVGWYRAELSLSRELIRRAVPDRSSRIIDVGAGASTLVDSLLEDGYGAITLLDISEAALETTRERLRDSAESIEWIVADLTTWMPTKRYDVWHDRAVFHFLTSASARLAYVGALNEALAPSGTAIISTFAPHGPTSCAGLPVVRFDADALQQELGNGFTVVETHTEEHRTPADTIQPFNYFVIRRT